MAAIHRMLAAMVMVSALSARPTAAQAGSSVSLTHTVTVTVPPRVKVQVGAVVPGGKPTTAAASTQSGALAVSVSATQSWTLSIGSAKHSQLQWSTDMSSGFAAVSGRDAIVASGEISQTPAAATLFFRNAMRSRTSDRAGSDSSEAVMLTMVAP